MKILNIALLISVTGTTLFAAHNSGGYVGQRNLLGSTESNFLNGGPNRRVIGTGGSTLANPSSQNRNLIGTEGHGRRIIGTEGQRTTSSYQNFRGESLNKPLRPAQQPAGTTPVVKDIRAL